MFIYVNYYSVIMHPCYKLFLDVYICELLFRNYASGRYRERVWRPVNWVIRDFVALNFARIKKSCTFARSMGKSYTASS